MFQVKAAGDDVQFQWQKNCSNIQDSDTRYRGANSDTLRILEVKKEDRGYYRCRVKSEPGEKFSKEVVLTVSKLVKC